MYLLKIHYLFIFYNVFLFNYIPTVRYYTLSCLNFCKVSLDKSVCQMNKWLNVNVYKKQLSTDRAMK